MVKRTGPTDLNLKNLINELNKAGKNAKIWKRVAEDLAKPTRQRRIVNLERIERFAKDNETVVVPGKVLANGELTKKVTVAAWTFSEAAKRKINAKGKTLTIRQLVKENPKGSKVRILG
ncbi:50S ribosomal protein L18e [Candidatus Woesearchaeota archaeon]|nr:MAG: 50S ribosomal protein L18e [Candidatus Woesearchaeota archaeon]